MTAPIAPSLKNYIDQFLTGLGITPTPGAEAALASVEHYEGPNDRYNPFNTVQVEPGSSSFNSVGVQRYASFDTGVQGGIDLFSGSHWNNVRQALAGGNESSILNAFDAAYTWSPGTNIPALSGSALTTELARDVGSSPGSGNITPGGTPTATNAGFDPNPLNWPGEIAGGTISQLGEYISSVIQPVITFAENSALVIFGGLFVLVGLVLVVHAASNDKEDEGPAPSKVGEAEDAAVTA